MYLPSLPFEIIISILLLLPAKELIKFLVTCKSWYALIKSQEFIKKHHETSTVTGENHILYTHIETNSEKTFALLNHKTFHYESDLRVSFDLPDALNSIIVSSVNGLICLADINRFGHTYLTNPSINKYLILPPSSIYSDESELQFRQMCTGFGYHERTNDFKVVRIGFIDHDWLIEDYYEEPITPPRAYDFECRAEIFSLNTKVWKTLNLSPNFCYNRHDIFSGVVVNECLHWKAIKSNTYEDKMVILSFHMGDGIFHDIECPIFSDEERINRFKCFGEFKGKLGFFTYCPIECWYGPGEQPCHLWTMEEYGVINSWTCQTIIVPGMSICKPLAFTRNGEIIMRDRSGKIFCCDYNNNQLLDLNIQDDKHDLNFINYTESLVLVDLNDEPMEDDVGEFDDMSI
ncbi:F-box/kelch-repeat protein At3g23880-like [Solanum dulcamara]|uniref:F-box/kelch-repeat protein At3g23880-like n=1 Tax=Solanum dulcamara TaxID=45834 RepID=UPI002485B14C|nr:F-box/kelch-repeat protein At3g23880-like [Solanum dulcamara]